MHRWPAFSDVAQLHGKGQGLQLVLGSSLHGCSERGENGAGSETWEELWEPCVLS